MSKYCQIWCLCNVISVLNYHCHAWTLLLAVLTELLYDCVYSGCIGLHNRPLCAVPDVGISIMY